MCHSLGLPGILQGMLGGRWTDFFASSSSSSSSSSPSEKLLSSSSWKPSSAAKLCRSRLTAWPLAWTGNRMWRQWVGSRIWHNLIICPNESVNRICRWLSYVFSSLMWLMWWIHQWKATAGTNASCNKILQLNLHNFFSHLPLFTWRREVTVSDNCSSWTGSWTLAYCSRTLQQDGDLLILTL